MAYRDIIVERIGPVEVLTLGRGDRLSTLTMNMVAELRDYWGGLAERLDVRIVIVRGAEQHFCAGLDLAEPSDAPTEGPAYGLPYMKRFGDIVSRMRRAPQVIIGALGGAVAGGGFAIALGCDLRIAAEDAIFTTAFLRLGLAGAEMGISYLLPRQIGSAAAADIILTGRRVDAGEALRLGLVSRVVTREALLDAAQSLAGELSGSAPLALRLTKDLLVSGEMAPSLEQAMELEARSQALCFVSGDVIEGRRAFRAGEPARFATHRTP